uniref:Uncharacterized protein n=1 Tax=uncultured prokaryote TaxID=198431 RepID=A0A0H5Q7Q5_9ZZZZ|nr:hypothetical protein [uncultured prokaryote]
MANYYAQTSLAAVTGNTEDAASNTFAVETDSLIVSLDIAAWTTAIENFYSAAYSAGALRGYTQAGSGVKFYDCNTPQPNYPIDEDSLSWTGVSTPTDLPAEVSLCVSYANDTATAVPRARRRGRIYINGWTETSNDAGRPDSADVTAMSTAFGAYCDALYAFGGIRPGVWSRTNATVYPIQRVWVDNEWDTMRSRGGKSTARVTVLVP